MKRFCRLINNCTNIATYAKQHQLIVAKLILLLENKRLATINIKQQTGTVGDMCKCEPMATEQGVKKGRD